MSLRSSLIKSRIATSRFGFRVLPLPDPTLTLLASRRNWFSEMDLQNGRQELQKCQSSLHCGFANRSQAYPLKNSMSLKRCSTTSSQWLISGRRCKHRSTSSIGFYSKVTLMQIKSSQPKPSHTTIEILLCLWFTRYAVFPSTGQAQVSQPSSPLGWSTLINRSAASCRSHTLKGITEEQYRCLR